MISYIFISILLLILPIFSLVKIQPETVAVTTIFGKFHRILRTGLHAKIPFIENIFKRISLENISQEMTLHVFIFEKVTANFEVSVGYAAKEDAESVKNVAFRFISENDFPSMLISSAEKSLQKIVAEKQSEDILSQRNEISEKIKLTLLQSLNECGYRLVVFNLNAITFGKQNQPVNITN